MQQRNDLSLIFLDNILHYPIQTLSMTFYQEIVDRSLSQKIYHFRNHFQNSTSISCIHHFPLLPYIIHQGKNENLYTLFFYPVDIVKRDIPHNIDNHKA